MDELDIEIFRTSQAEMAVAPSSAQIKSSLSSIAARIGAGDLTVSRRYKKLEESGTMLSWKLILNPTLFGRNDGQSGGRATEIRQARHDQENQASPRGPSAVRLLRARLGILAYKGEEACSRIEELVSRVTNAGTMTQIRWAPRRPGFGHANAGLSTF